MTQSLVPEYELLDKINKFWWRRLGICWLFRMVHRALWLYILDKERFRESRDISQSWLYLTFLNIPQLERQDADIQSKVEELEEVNQSLRSRDKLKDDAISQLSDQLVALSTRLQEIERRQQLLTWIYYRSRPFYRRFGGMRDKFYLNSQPSGGNYPIVV